MSATTQETALQMHICLCFMTSISKQAKSWLCFAMEDQWFDYRALSGRVRQDPLDSLMMMINELPLDY